VLLVVVVVVVAVGVVVVEVVAKTFRFMLRVGDGWW
jgi:hypothetical protein